LKRLCDLHCQKHGLPQLNDREFASQMKKEEFSPSNRRLSPQEQEKWEKLGFPIVSLPCRGWWCNGVTLVTDLFSLINKETESNINIKERTTVTTVTVLQTKEGGISDGGEGAIFLPYDI
jgi:hypothetical protein